MKFTILALPALALAHLGAMLFEPMNSLCVVWTVVEQPLHINTCFPSSTVDTISGYTTTISSATCIDTTVTESVTLNPLAPTPTEELIEQTTLTTSIYTTFIDHSRTFIDHVTTFTYGTKTFTITEPTTITVTDCPCTYSIPKCDYTEYTTITTDILTTVCPSPITFTHGTHTYTITEATTLTITDFPCTFTRKKHSSKMMTTSQVFDGYPQLRDSGSIDIDLNYFRAYLFISRTGSSNKHNNSLTVITESTPIAAPTSTPIVPLQETTPIVEATPAVLSTYYSPISPSSSAEVPISSPSVPIELSSSVGVPMLSSSVPVDVMSSMPGPSPSSSAVIDILSTLPGPPPDSTSVEVPVPSPSSSVDFFLYCLPSVFISIETSSTIDLPIPSSSLIDVPSPSSSSLLPESTPSEISVPSSTIPVFVSTSIVEPTPISSSVQVDIPTSILISISQASMTASFSPSPTSNLCAGEVRDASCDGNPFGACCGSDDTCGHDAAHCCIGCQPGYGYCTTISNDGTCGNGISCVGSPFGDCCSKLFFCGNETAFCDTGCHPEFGRCNTSPTFSVLLLPSSTQVVPSPNPTSVCTQPSMTSGTAYCQNTVFTPGTVPSTIGNTTLASDPDPAVYIIESTLVSFGFEGTCMGDKAMAATNPSVVATDDIAFYQADATTVPPTQGCQSFGYFYHVNSGMCVEAIPTSDSFPRFQNSELTLQPCNTCSGNPPTEQLFCFDNVATVSTNGFYCIWLRFPEPPVPSSTPAITPSNTQAPTSTLVTASAIASASASAIPCGGMVYAPGFHPQNIGDASLTSTPAPAVYVNTTPLTWSFGFNGSNEIGSVAYAEFNPTVPATDKIAYYQVPTSRILPTADCQNFGYLYHQDTGMCIEGNATAGTYPRFEAGGSYLPYHCMVFYGDTISTDPFYSINYGDGPNLSVATLSTVIDDCIYLLSPEKPQPSSSVESVPSSTQVSIPSSTIEILISSTVNIPSATPSVPCSQAAPAPPGETPATLGNAVLYTNPQPANYFNTAFSFIGVTEGSLAYAIYYSVDPATDTLAFYIVPSGNPIPQGYIYHIDSGLCATANQASDTIPIFQQARITL
ncbi:hypothetical protein IFR05_001119 [Cadophora sp. M221]|nr:hypothetical protein IFR05_001119 [Cadophora sp. M221]